MVAPVTGPFNSISGSRTGLHYKSIYGYKQAKPYTLVLELIHRQAGYTLNGGKFTFYNPGQVTDWEYGICASTNAEAATDNVCYSKFVSKLKAQSASLGTTLGEQQSARNMIVARTKQMHGLGVALVKRDFKSAYRIVRGTDGSSRKKSTKSQDLANAWLEWSWGWAPMYQDITDALKTLCDPITPIYVRASHTKEDAWCAYLSDTLNDVNIGGVFGPLHQYTREDWKYKYRVSTGAAIAVSNPNVALLNRLGVLNIPQAMWAVQPFSFLVDKYLNVGQMIGAVSDTFGFTLSNTWTTRRVDIFATGSGYETHPALSTPPWYCSGKSHVKYRKSGALTPSFAFRTPSIGSLGEAASYFALLYQMLTR